MGHTHNHAGQFGDGLTAFRSASSSTFDQRAGNDGPVFAVVLAIFVSAMVALFETVLRVRSAGAVPG